LQIVININILFYSIILLLLLLLYFYYYLLLFGIIIHYCCCWCCNFRQFCRFWWFNWDIIIISIRYSIHTYVHARIM